MSPDERRGGQPGELARSLAALTFAIGMLASPAKAQSVPASYESRGLAHVRFEAADAGVVLSRSDGAAGWVSLGVAPLELTLPPGAIVLALSFQNRPPVRVPFVVEVAEGSEWLAHYESRQPLRELGVGLLLGTAALTLVGIAIGVGGVLSHEDATAIAGFVAGASIAIVGTASGLALATLDDVATIDVL